MSDFRPMPHDDHNDEAAKMERLIHAAMMRAIPGLRQVPRSGQPNGGPCACGRIPMLPAPGPDGKPFAVRSNKVADGIHTARACFVPDRVSPSWRDPLDGPLPGRVHERGTETRLADNIVTEADAVFGGPITERVHLGVFPFGFPPLPSNA